MWGKVSESCDVYSFIILVLELVSGRKPIEKLFRGLKRTINEWVKPLFSKGKFKEMVDSKLRRNFVKEEINVFAPWLQSRPEKRPNKQVINLLKGQEYEVVEAKYFKIATQLDS